MQAAKAIPFPIETTVRKEKSSPTRAELLRESAESIRRLRETLTLLTTELSEGDLDLAELIAPSR